MQDMLFEIERFHARLIDKLSMETRAGLIAEVQIAAAIAETSIPEGIDLLEDAELIALYDRQTLPRAA